MSETATTSNGHEIRRPSPEISADELRQRLGSEFGIEGNTPTERARQLKKLSVEGVAIMLEDINKSVQGSVDSLVSHDASIKIGGRETIRPEDRYTVFSRLIEDIKSCSDDVNPARIGDTLALGVVLLHPFHDGNGRTARVLGLVFRDSYDSEEYTADFKTVTEPRDKARERGGWMINGYVPHFPEGFDQSDALQVSDYLSGLLLQENENAYTSCYGQAPLHVEDKPAIQ